MVSIPDEIHISDLEYIDGWQIGLVLELVDAGPSLWIDLGSRQEGTVEIPITAHATHNPVQWDLLEAYVVAWLVEVELFPHIAKRQEIVRPARELGQDILHKAASACSVKDLQRRCTRSR
jgi:hypothetical protein